MTTNTLIVLRRSGERTAETCLSNLTAQMSHDCIRIVEAAPFEHALEQSYQIGLHSGAKWLLTVDGDILPRKNAVSALVTYCERQPRNVFMTEGVVLDKLTISFRKAGHRLYRVEHLAKALEFIPRAGTQLRPESFVCQKMKSNGHSLSEVGLVFGLHDHEQYYCDIFRKAFVYATKHAHWLPRMIEQWKILAADDPDFLVALKGVSEGLLRPGSAPLDARQYGESAEVALAKLGLVEKPPLPTNLESCRFDAIESEIISRMDMMPASMRFKGAPLHERLAYHYRRFGPAGFLAFALGASFCAAGIRMKNLADILKRGRS